MRKLLEILMIALLAIPTMLIAYVCAWILGGWKSGWQLHAYLHAPKDEGMPRD